MNQHKTVPRKKKVYGNVLVLGPDNTPLFRCGEKKAKFYIKKDLVEFIHQASPTQPLILRLKFQPGGNGHAHDEPYFLALKYNRCVVCGDMEKLTRHHIIPYMYWRYFPKWVRVHNEYDLVALCTECHDTYEVVASVLKDKIH